MDFLHNLKEKADVKRKAVKEAEQIFVKLNRKDRMKTNPNRPFPVINRDYQPDDYSKEYNKTEKQVVDTRLKQWKDSKKK